MLTDANFNFSDKKEARPNCFKLNFPPAGFVFDDFKSTMNSLRYEATEPSQTNFFKQIIDQISKKTAGETSETVFKINEFEKLPDTEKIFTIATLSKDQKSYITPFAPILFAKSTTPLVAKTIINAFPNIWPQKIFGSTNFIDTRPLEVQISSLETFFENFTQVFPSKFPTLYGPPTTDNLDKTWESTESLEAVKIISEAVFAEDNKQKLLALQKCRFIPFHLIKPTIFKLLAAEDNHIFLAAACHVLEANPTPEIPFNLFEIIEEATPEKAKKLKKFLSYSCKLLESTGILGDNFQTYMQKLQAWIAKKTATKLVHQFITHVSEENSIDPSWESALKQHLSKPIVRQTFEDALQWDIEPSAKKAISKFLGIESSHSNIEEEPLETKLDNFHRLSDLEKIRALAAATKEVKEKVRNIIISILKDRNSPLELIGTAIRTANRLRIPNLSEYTARFLNNNDPVPTISAIEYCSEFDEDRIIPLIGKFLNSNNLQIKIAALKVLKKSDLPQALEFIKKLLNSKNKDLQNQALSCMFHFDFRLVRDILSEFLFKLPEESLFQSALFLFRSNPEPENIPILEKLEAIVPKSKKKDIHNIRKETIEILVDLGVIKPESIQDITAKHIQTNSLFDATSIQSEDKLSTTTQTLKVKVPLQQEKQTESTEMAKSKNQPKGLTQSQTSEKTAISDISKSIIDIFTNFLEKFQSKAQFKGKGISESEWIKGLKELGANFWLAVAGFCIFFLTMILIGLQSDSIGSHGQEGKSLSGSPTTIIGTIEKVDKKSDEIIILSKDGTRYLLPIPVNSKIPEQNSKVKAIVLPFLLGKDGMVRARIVAMERVN